MDWREKKSAQNYFQSVITLDMTIETIRAIISIVRIWYRFETFMLNNQLWFHFEREKKNDKIIVDSFPHRWHHECLSNGCYLTNITTMNG